MSDVYGPAFIAGLLWLVEMFLNCHRMKCNELKLNVAVDPRAIPAYLLSGGENLFTNLSLKLGLNNEPTC